jgi:hypothetical protein
MDATQIACLEHVRIGVFSQPRYVRQLAGAARGQATGYANPVTLVNIRDNLGVAAGADQDN